MELVRLVAQMSGSMVLISNHSAQNAATLSCWAISLPEKDDDTQESQAALEGFHSLLAARYQGPRGFKSVTVLATRSCADHHGSYMYHLLCLSA